MPGHVAGRAAVRAGRVRVRRPRVRRVSGARPPHGRRVRAVDGPRGRAPGQPSGADDRGRRGRAARTDRRRPVHAVGPDVALRVAHAGRDRPIDGQGAVPGRVATQVRGQRGDHDAAHRVHVRPVQGRVARTAGGRGRAARGGPRQDGRPQRASCPRVHVSHQAQGDQNAGRVVPGHRRHRGLHAGQANELHARLQRAKRRQKVRMGRNRLEIELHVHRPVG